MTMTENRETPNRAVGDPDRVVRAGDLVGLAEATERLGIAQENRSTVSNWATKREITGFPLPVAVLKGTPVYFWPDIADWAGERWGEEWNLPEDSRTTRTDD
jgi:hypothetical protein